MGIFCMAQQTQTGALYQSRGVEWGGVGVGGRFKREGMYIYIYLWLIPTVRWQKPAQHCKAIILRLKKKTHTKKPDSCGEYSDTRNEGVTGKRQ